MEDYTPLAHLTRVLPPAGAKVRLFDDRRAWELVPRFCGDELLDHAVSREDAGEAVEAVFGEQRATKVLVRAFADALLGPPSGRWPGRNAALWSISVAKAVDTDVPGERLEPQDLAMIVRGGACRGAPIRREPLRRQQRELLRALLRGTPRQLRIALGNELVFDPSDEPEQLARGLARSRVSPREIPPAHPRSVRELYRAACLLTGRLATIPYLVTPTAQGLRDYPVTVVGDYEVRVIRNLGQANFEGRAMRNCLGDMAPRVIRRDHTLVTVWHRHRPLATIEFDPAGDIRTALGHGNRCLDRTEKAAIEDVLCDAGLLSPHRPEQPANPAEEVAARISCRAATLLAADLEPEPTSLPSDGYEHGDLAMELLGARARYLDGAQRARLRGQPPPDTSCPEPFSDDQEWTRIAAMLALTHSATSNLDPPDTPHARFVARLYASRLLRREATLPNRPPPQDSWAHQLDPDLPEPARQGIAEVLKVWSTW